VAGNSEQFTPGGYLSAVIHTTLAWHRTNNLLIVSPTRYQTAVVRLPGVS